MLIVALVMAVIGLAALITAVVTSNEVIAWVCIGASVIGVVLLIIDALRERQRPDEGATPAEPEQPTEVFDAEYPADAAPDESSTTTIAHDADHTGPVEPPDSGGRAGE
jgi:hypothetical protein